MYIYVCMYLYIHIYKQTHKHIYMYIHIYIYVYIYVHVWVYMRKHIRIAVWQNDTLVWQHGTYQVYIYMYTCIAYDVMYLHTCHVYMDSPVSDSESPPPPLPPPEKNESNHTYGWVKSHIWERPDWGVYSKRGRQVCIASTCLLVNFREASRKDWVAKKGKFVFDIPHKSAPFVPSRVGCSKLFVGQRCDFRPGAWPGEHSPGHGVTPLAEKSSAGRKKVWSTPHGLVQMGPICGEYQKLLIFFLPVLAGTNPKIKPRAPGHVHQVTPLAENHTAGRKKVWCTPHGLVQMGPIYGESQIQTCLF